ncbi:SDR family NAD(P)-dependent oxidoreductase [Amycolatopsis jiangsuensis]|uniref:NAD(P)-dependent dehydrogenase (Short-subunit alcohol dehydrogenase family) n=1 Tax=Amycolatopsis jiangsuensis TaxID=1181879 RepID=A0A840IY76_9PSEU|nr:SDR family oxidoreductase [Amycolatopsis jiangsuensis]MBB4686800.1 NAD(P)-dependent dehydrogenase (short-subunit alcohol dehydrogenase family) [Amycolatopsis jiangsuensis]
MQDRVVVITGGAGGIGRACVEAVLDGGGRPVVVDAAPGTAEVPHYQADVTDEERLAVVMADVAARYGRIDVLVNNAAVVRSGDVEETALDDWALLWDVNVLGYVRATRAALPYLRRSEAGAIVNMSSFTAAAGFRRRVAYATTKGAIEALTRALAADLIADGITVNAIRPGTVDTALLASLAAAAPDREAARATYAARQPTGRMVSAAEVAHAVLFLADPVNRSTTGAVIAVDGGISDTRSTPMD